MEDTVAVYLARHGSTQLNSDNRFRGGADPPLSDKGFREANRLAHYLQPIDLSFIVASARRRSVATAELIYLSKMKTQDNAEYLKPVSNDLLSAWNVGDFSGKPKDQENLDKLQFYIDNPDEVIPGGESLSGFRYRVRPLIKEAIEVAQEVGVPGLLVVHSSVIHEIGILFHNDNKHALVKPGGLAAVYISNGQLRAQAVFKPEFGQHSEAS